MAPPLPVYVISQLSTAVTLHLSSNGSLGLVAVICLTRYYTYKCWPCRSRLIVHSRSPLRMARNKVPARKTLPASESGRYFYLPSSPLLMSLISKQRTRRGGRHQSLIWAAKPAVVNGCPEQLAGLKDLTDINLVCRSKLFLQRAGIM